MKKNHAIIIWLLRVLKRSADKLDFFNEKALDANEKFVD